MAQDPAEFAALPIERDIRPRFHLAPPANWMNDPNGPIFRDGRLHVFYQYNPVAPHWDTIHWGHAVTDDLINWEHRPVALVPDPSGPDAFGCWSGCIVDDEDTPTLFYTGIVLDGDVRRASICRATSDDRLDAWVKGITPVIAEAPPGYFPDAFRDPFVWRDGQGWAMLVGAGSTDGAGAVLLYRSPDLMAWTFVGPFLSAEDLAETRLAGGPCWECPQLLRFGDRATLILSITNPAPESRPSHVIAIAGRLEADRFVPGDIVLLDGGPDFYAPASVVAPDGRHLLLGWIPEDPPDDPDHGRDWAGAMTIPREIALRPDGGLAIAPARELVSMRGLPTRRDAQAILPDAHTWPHIPVADRFELIASIQPADATAVGVEMHDGDDPDPEMRITFRPSERRVSVKRRGTVVVGGPDEHNVMVLPADAPLALDLRVIVDGSVMEVFVDGRVAATFRLPSVHRGRRRVTIFSLGGSSRLTRFDVWPLIPDPLAEDRSAAG
jgi:beta-fructofuranosidase